MRRFNFRLQRVEDVRAVKKKQCERQLAQSQQELQKEEKRLAEATHTFQASNEGLRQALTKNAHAGLLQHLDHWRRRQEQDLGTQTRRTETQRETVDQHREDLIHAAKEKKVLEKLRERRQTEHQNGCLKEEQAFLDELGCRIGFTYKVALRDEDLKY